MTVFARRLATLARIAGRAAVRRDAAPDHALHVAAWCLLHARPPQQALAILARLARPFARLDAGAAARHAAELDGFGSCLSRALALAVRVPGAEVVLSVTGVPPSFSAHAWVEVGGRPLRDADVAGTPVARWRTDGTSAS